MNGKPRIREMRDGILYINCSKCGGMFPDSEFSHHRNSKGILYANSYCKECESEIGKMRTILKMAQRRGVSADVIIREREVRRIRREQIAEAAKHAGIVTRESSNNRANICIDCQNACGGCSWTRCDTDRKGKPIMFQPVEGWTAEKIYRRDTNGYVMETYAITACPEFIPDKPRKTQDIVDGK